jgi:RNA polymerase sigma factor (TIGR02999 family)
VRWEHRAHFFTTAASTMRRILIDHARAHRARKRLGSLQRVDIDHVPVIASDEDADRLLVVDAALEQLARWDARQARVVELKFFAGLTVDEIARVLDVSPKTVKRDWSMARAWLQRQIEGRSPQIPEA